MKFSFNEMELLVDAVDMMVSYTLEKCDPDSTMYQYYSEHYEMYTELLKRLREERY